jgi:poly(ADP-ribose) glycohydrolase ARH3
LDVERFQGCLLGLALGDALGAAHQGGALERMLWRVIGKTRSGLTRWSDDTQMSLDLAESLIAHRSLHPQDLASRFATSYRWSRGYGPGTSRVLRRVARGIDWRDPNRSVHGGGSLGNGGAMRAPVVGLFYSRRPTDLAAATRLSASVTHAHPMGMEGAALVASATGCALLGHPPTRSWSARPPSASSSPSAHGLRPRGCGSLHAMTRQPLRSPVGSVLESLQASRA